MIRLGEKSQAEIAELFNIDRSTISRMMKEAREKELVKAVQCEYRVNISGKCVRFLGF
jgi:DNA-binding transcriptional regulator LsrR (DeoR family)